MTEEECTLICKALGDKIRTDIVYLIKEKGEICARDILEHFQIAQPTLSYHMKALCECKIVDARKEGLWSYYSIDCDRLREWLEFLNVAFLK